MNNAPGSPPKQDPKALELTLHDSLDRLQEFALMLAFQGSGQQFEILSITPPAEPVTATPPHPPHSTGNVINLRRTLLKRTT